jgi:16S rRNA (uracil1498-N3)-methyltransferase
MKCFILPGEPDQGGLIRLSGKDHHYLTHVRRLRNGDRFKALAPGGEELEVRVRSTEDGCLVGECCATPGGGCRDQLPPLALFQALPKGAKMDLIVRQAAEGAITEIVPFVSEHSIPRIQGNGKEERWTRIIKEARQQSGSGVATVIKPSCTLDALLGYWERLRRRYTHALGLLFHQARGGFGAPGFHGYLGQGPDFVAFVIGPEGGFSDQELALFTGAGFKPLVLGTTVLRTETAAVYAAAAIRIILLENSSWMQKIPG